MTKAVYQLDTSYIEFPPVEHALDEPNGLIAIGGDLSPSRLLEAYRNGIFPWYSPGENILWWSPNPRGILELEELHISRSLAKALRKTPFTYSINTCFSDVILQCAYIRSQYEGTWITEEMIAAYNELHRLGHAHSVEVKLDGELVGGLYGIASGAVFCGESMFHKATNASKAASCVLVQLLKQAGFHFIDCQMQNDHLESLGAKEVSRQEFQQRLKKAQEIKIAPKTWQSRDYLYKT